MVHANKISEWMCDFFLKFLMVYFASLPVISIGWVLFCWLIFKDLNVESFYHPFKIMLVVLASIYFYFESNASQFYSRLPWNQTTYLGYSGEISFSTITTVAYFLVVGSVFLLFISMCMYYRSFCEMFEKSISTWDQLGENRFDYDFICDLIRFHISVKE